MFYSTVTASHKRTHVEDILNVRLQTLGVTEHSFDISLSGTHVNWLLYDVGGAVSIPLNRLSYYSHSRAFRTPFLTQFPMRSDLLSYSVDRQVFQFASVLTPQSASIKLTIVILYYDVNRDTLGSHILKMVRSFLS